MVETTASTRTLVPGEEEKDENSDSREEEEEEEEEAEEEEEKLKLPAPNPLDDLRISASVVSRSLTTVCASTPLMKMGTGTRPPSSRVSISSGR